MPQRKREKKRKEQRKTLKTGRKQLTNHKKYTFINNYFKCKWTKLSKQKT